MQERRLHRVTEFAQCTTSDHARNANALSHNQPAKIGGVEFWKEGYANCGTDRHGTSLEGPGHDSAPAARTLMFNRGPTGTLAVLALIGVVGRICGVWWYGMHQAE